MKGFLSPSALSLVVLATSSHALVPGFVPSITSRRAAGTVSSSRVIAHAAEEPDAAVVNCSDDEILALLDVDSSTTEEIFDNDESEDEEAIQDKAMMLEALTTARSIGGERSPSGPFPRPLAGAVLVSSDGRILGKGRSDYSAHAIEYAFKEAGINATPLREWCVAWPSDSKFRKDVSESTLYVTMEPSNERQGEEKPPITQLIQMVGIPRLVIGCSDPILENAMEGAGRLHAAGVSVTMGVREEECRELIRGYAELCNTKLHRMGRQHFRRFGRVSNCDDVWG
jgi:diaminohydroxyphosphoribosylaminopyrimidine deaminase/5-amino-6-(5-phosphoribosylamino)uracil reductase